MAASEPLNARREIWRPYFAAQNQGRFRPDGPYIIAGYFGAGRNDRFRNWPNKLVLGGLDRHMRGPFFGAPYPHDLTGCPSQIKNCALPPRGGQRRPGTARRLGILLRRETAGLVVHPGRNTASSPGGVLASQFRVHKISLAGIAGSQSSPSLDAESNQRIRGFFSQTYQGSRNATFAGTSTLYT